MFCNYMTIIMNEYFIQVYKFFELRVYFQNHAWGLDKSIYLSSVFLISLTFSRNKLKLEISKVSYWVFIQNSTDLCYINKGHTWLTTVIITFTTSCEWEWSGIQSFFFLTFVFGLKQILGMLLDEASITHLFCLQFIHFFCVTVNRNVKKKTGISGISILFP